MRKSLFTSAILIAAALVTSSCNKAKPEGAKKEDPAPTKEVDNIINNPNPAWTKQPTDLKEEDYKSFYRELYPMQFEENHTR